MKYACLGYADFKKLEVMSDRDRDATIERCLAYDAELKRKGLFLRGEALEGPKTATTLRLQDGKVSVTDGPYAETREQLGGILVLEATNLNHAIQIMSKHPGIAFGPWEIRPLNEEFTAHANARIS